MRGKNSLVIGLGIVAACATTQIQPFVMSNEAMMAKVAMEIPFGAELKRFFETSAGKSVVVVNIENDKYTNDENPEYILDDAFYARLTNKRVKIFLLDRDPDVLQLMIAERQGQMVQPMEGVDGNADSLTVEERRKHIGQLITDLIQKLAPQDVLVHHQVTGQAKQPLYQIPSEIVGVRKGSIPPAPFVGDSVVSPEIVANELGVQKAELLRHLLSQYTLLYPPPAGKPPRVKLDMSKADYLLAYRIYEFGPWASPVPKGGIERTTYAKLHIRVIDMTNGQIIASDFMEHSIVDQLTDKEFATLRNTKASPADYRRPASRTKNKGSKLNPLNWF